MAVESGAATAYIQHTPDVVVTARVEVAPTAYPGMMSDGLQSRRKSEHREALVAHHMLYVGFRNRKGGRAQGSMSPEIRDMAE